MFQDANDYGLGVFLAPFSGLQLVGLFEEEESRVVEERQTAVQSPSSSPTNGP